MGMTHSQLSLAFSGARRLQLEEVAQLSSIFGEPIHRVIEAAGVSVRPVSGQRITVIGVMRGDGSVEMHPEGVAERTTADCELPEDAVAIQCRTAGTPLEWMDAFVMFTRQRNGSDHAFLGRLCFAKLRDGPHIIATLKRGYVDHTYNCLSPYRGESCAIEWATPVVFTRN
jgi:hypothetical protein